MTTIPGRGGSVTTFPGMTVSDLAHYMNGHVFNLLDEINELWEHVARLERQLGLDGKDVA